jgi:AbrB family looped-hinge helix DNA binding protein
MKVMPMEEPQIVTVGTKGQLVIPNRIRKELGIKPKTRLAIYSTAGKLVAAKVEFPTLGDELNALFRQIDERYRAKKSPTEREILAEIQAYRREKRSVRVA